MPRPNTPEERQTLRQRLAQNLLARIDWDQFQTIPVQGAYYLAGLKILEMIDAERLLLCRMEIEQLKDDVLGAVFPQGYEPPFQIPTA